MPKKTPQNAKSSIFPKKTEKAALASDLFLPSLRESKSLTKKKEMNVCLTPIAAETYL